jgi:nucleotide-binding universal stress UspA family protein
MFNHILLATDNMKQGRWAARTAGETARQMHSASLCIVVTYSPVPDFLGILEIEKKTAARLSQAEALVECLLQEVGVIPGELQTEILEGPLAEVVATVSQVRGSDLIVMSSGKPQRLERLTEWFHGCQVVDHERCPVMTLP